MVRMQMLGQDTASHEEATRRLVQRLSSDEGKRQAIEAVQKTQAAIDSLNKARQVEPRLLQEPVTL
jgi:hypothetical protein